MGSCYSAHLLYNNNSNICFICGENIKSDYIKCSICNILIHENCFERNIGQLKGKPCSYCQEYKSLYLCKKEYVRCIN
jgi:hypothetical protein